MTKNNEPVEDFLENDQPIPGQNYVCLSFVSPNSLIEKRENFYMQEFFKKNCEQLGINKNDALNFLKKYEDFKYGNSEDLDKVFNQQNEFTTSVRGLKVRGVYDTIREAQVRAKVLQRRDPNFNVYVGQIGYWLPWDPEPHKVSKEEYLEGQLNDLVKNYKQNREEGEEMFSKETKDRVEKAKESGKTSVKELVDAPNDNKTPQENDLVFDSRTTSKSKQQMDNLSLEEKQVASDSNLQQIKGELFESKII